MPNRLSLIAAPLLLALSASLASAAPGTPHPGQPAAGHAHCAPGKPNSVKSQPCKPAPRAGTPAKHGEKQRARAHQQSPRKALRVGEQIKPAEYRKLANPARYKLETRSGWSYYRDGQTIYRVDNRNHRVISVLAMQGAPRR